MVNAVPHIRCDKYGTSWDLVIAETDISSLRVLHGFTVDHNYDPMCPIDGVLPAQRRAHQRFLDAALEAITKGWGSGPALCYRRLANLKGLGAQLESMLKDKESVSPIFSYPPTPSILANVIAVPSFAVVLQPTYIGYVATTQDAVWLVDFRRAYSNYWRLGRWQMLVPIDKKGDFKVEKESIKFDRLTKKSIISFMKGFIIILFPITI